MFLAFLVGVFVGAVFFGGLYITVQQLTTTKHPALLMMLSLIIRLVVLVAGVYLIMDGKIENLVSAMAGILLVRFVMIGKLGKGNPKETKEGD